VTTDSIGLIVRVYMIPGTLWLYLYILVKHVMAF